MLKLWRYDPPGIQAWHVKEGRSSDPVVDLRWRVQAGPPDAELSLDVQFWSGYGHSMNEFLPLFSRLDAYEMAIAEDRNELLAALRELGYEQDQEHAPM